MNTSSVDSARLERIASRARLEYWNLRVPGEISMNLRLRVQEFLTRCPGFWEADLEAIELVISEDPKLLSLFTDTDELVLAFVLREAHN